MEETLLRLLEAAPQLAITGIVLWFVLTRLETRMTEVRDDIRTLVALHQVGAVNGTKVSGKSS